MLSGIFGSWMMHGRYALWMICIQKKIFRDLQRSDIQFETAMYLQIANNTKEGSELNPTLLKVL